MAIEPTDVCIWSTSQDNSHVEKRNTWFWKAPHESSSGIQTFLAAFSGKFSFCSFDRLCNNIASRLPN